MPRLDPNQQQVRMNGARQVTAGADAFGGQSAQAAAAFGAQTERTGDVVAQVDDAKSRIRAANAMTTADLNWRQQMITMQNDPEFAKKYGEDGSLFADSFKDQFEQYASDQIANADGRDKKYIEQGMYNLGESLMGSAMQYQAEVGSQFTSDTLKKSISNGSVSARLSPDQYTSILANATLAVSTAEGIDPTVRRRYAEAAMKDITTGAALGRLEKGGVGAAQQIKDGSMAFMAVDETGTPVKKTLRELVDADTFDTLTNQADTVIRKAESDAKQAQSDMRSDIDMKIEMAETPDEFMEASRAITDNASAFTHDQLNDIKVKLFKATKKIREDYDSVDRGNAFASGDTYLNPMDSDAKKDFNNYYNKRVAPALSSMTPEERSSYLVKVTKNAGILAEGLKGDLYTAARSSDPKQVASAANMVDQLRMAAPHLVQDIDQTSLARIDMVNSKLAAGIPMSTAVQQVDEAMNVSNDAVFKKRDKDVKDMKLNYESMAVNNFKSNLFARMLPGDSGSVEDTSSEFATHQIAQLTSEYQDAYETRFRTTGDTNAAERHANSVVAGNYEVTDINGRNQLMRNGPNKYFAIPNVDNSWMREQVVEKAKTAMKDTWNELGVSPNQAIIVPAPYVTPRTAKEGRPLYMLMIPTKTEGYVNVLGPNKFVTFDKQKKINEIIENAKREKGTSASIQQSIKDAQKIDIGDVPPEGR
jgi:hypothetical protein